MNKYNLLILIFLFISSAKALGQELYTHTDVQMKNGIYMTVEEFRNNSPSHPITVVANQENDFLQSSFCTDELSYIENGEVAFLKTKDIWGVTINGVPYIRHKQNPVSVFKSNNCFYRIFKVGAISTYFVQEIKGVNRSQYDPYSPNDVKLVILEYAIDLETGETYDQKKDFNDIVRIIKSDPFFKDQKIKKKEIGVFITQYNQRNPVEVKIN